MVKFHEDEEQLNIVVLDRNQLLCELLSYIGIEIKTKVYKKRHKLNSFEEKTIY